MFLRVQLRLFDVYSRLCFCAGAVGDALRPMKSWEPLNPTGLLGLRFAMRAGYNDLNKASLVALLSQNA